MTEETKHDLLLKRVQIVLAILTALVGLAVGGYNLKKSMAVTGPGAISATVDSEKGGVVSGARVELYSGQNALLYATMSKEDGKILFKDLDPGAYFLKVQARGFQSQSLNIQVNSKKTSDVEVVLEVAVAPAVVNATSSPIRSALEEVGASWIKTIGKPKNEAQQAEQAK